VASFILAMADRLSNGRSDRVTLPISRYDIADYLAVSVETVSRALSDLKQRGLIRFTGTRVVQIIDREALEDGKYDDVLKRTPPADRISAHPFLQESREPKAGQPLRTDPRPSGPSYVRGEPRPCAR
jgi:DNA-binding transcriptional MocR family regulator